MSITSEQFDQLLTEVRNISRGGVGAPLGLEAVTMAICGPVQPNKVPGENEENIIDCLHAITAALGGLTDAANNIHSVLVDISNNAK